MYEQGKQCGIVIDGAAEFRRQVLFSYLPKGEESCVQYSTSEESKRPLSIPLVESTSSFSAYLNVALCQLRTTALW